MTAAAAGAARAVMAAMILRVLPWRLAPSDQVIVDVLPGGARAGNLAIARTKH
jgi:hypothetical protein